MGIYLIKKSKIGEEDSSIEKQKNFRNLIKTKNITWQFILNEIYEIQNENFINSNSSKPSQMFRFKLKKYEFNQIKQNFLEIVNLMKNIDHEEINCKKRREYLELLIKENKRNKLLDAIRNGIPNCLRFKIYLYLMHIPISSHIESSDYSIIDTDSLLQIDYMIAEEIHNSISNENYFLFEEFLKKFMRKFIRDKNLIKEIQGIRPILLISNEENKFKLMNGIGKLENEFTPYPPSGLIPFPGLALQLACFCYMSTNINEIYKIGKSFYSRYLSFLSSFTSNRNSILSLLYGFHYLLGTDDKLKKLYCHFGKVGLNIHLIFLQWLSTCFADIITPGFVFILYDIILITDNTFILVVFSLSLLFHKSNILLSLNTKEEILNRMDKIKYENINVLDTIHNYLNT